MRSQLALVGSLVSVLLLASPCIAESFSSSGLENGDVLVAAGKKKKNRKSKGKNKKKRRAPAEESLQMGSGVETKDSSYKKFGLKASVGYISASKISDGVEAVESLGGTMELGFSYAVLASGHYYLNQNLFVLGEFAYGSFPYTAAIDNPILGQMDVVGSYTLMHFGGGAGYVLKFGSTSGLSIGATLGYSLISQSVVQDGGEESSNDDISGFSFSILANPFYEITPSIRIGLEPRIIYSLATKTAAEGETLTEKEKEGFGLSILVLLSAEFLF